MKDLQREFERAIPLEVAWDSEGVAGVGVPVLKVRDLDDVAVEVWSCTGKPDCAVGFRLPDGPTLFFTWFDQTTLHMTMNARVDKQYGAQEQVIYAALPLQSAMTWLISVDTIGFHVSWDGQVKYLFKHRVPWTAQVVENIIVESGKSKNHVIIVRKSARDAVLKLAAISHAHVQPGIDIDMTAWTLVFRQTAPFEFNSDRDFAQAKRLNAHAPEAPNYSILCDLEQVLLLQHTATRCSIMQHTTTHCDTLQHTATHCNTLQHAATRCNIRQHTATHCNTLQHTATHCNTLQHTATHCNTLQHIAPHCN